MTDDARKFIEEWNALTPAERTARRLRALDGKIQALTAQAQAPPEVSALVALLEDARDGVPTYMPKLVVDCIAALTAQAQALTALKEERDRLEKAWKSSVDDAMEMGREVDAKDAALEVIFMAIDRATLSDLADGGDLGPRAERAVRAIADLDAERLRRAKSEAAKDAALKQANEALIGVQNHAAKELAAKDAEIKALVAEVARLCDKLAALTSQREVQETPAQVLQHLVDHGAWYCSAIELDHDQDGDELLERANRALGR